MWPFVPADWTPATFAGGGLKALTLPDTAFKELRDHANEAGIVFLSTPFDRPSADLLMTLGVAAFKVPSGELTNHPFIAQLAALGQPLLVSTGMATLDEHMEAVKQVAVADRTWRKINETEPRWRKALARKRDSVWIPKEKSSSSSFSNRFFCCSVRIE